MKIFTRFQTKQCIHKLTHRGRRFTSTRNQLFERKLQQINTILFDCDGVIWKGDHVLPGVEKALTELRQKKINIYFITNNSTKSRQGTHAKFERLGLTASVDEVLTSSFAAAQYLRSIGFHDRKTKKKVYVLGDVGITEELTLAGIESIGGRSHADRSVDFSQTFEIDCDIGAVVAGLDVNINYYKLQYAQLCLNQDKECLFIATNTDEAGHFTKNQLWPGAGSTVAAISGCTGRIPIVVGKPESCLVDYIFEKANCTVDQVMMVGDRLDTDILFGSNHGILSCLTMTGVTTPHLLAHRDNKIIPNVVVDSVADLPGLISRV